MSASIIDGKAFAARVRGQVAEHVTRLKSDHGITPGLAVVLVGEDPASQVYVRSKGKQTVEAGMKSVEHKLDAKGFLEQVCRKAGLPDNAWQRGDVQFYTYRGEWFGEEE